MSNKETGKYIGCMLEYQARLPTKINVAITIARKP